MFELLLQATRRASVSIEQRVDDMETSLYSYLLVCGTAFWFHAYSGIVSRFIFALSVFANTVLQAFAFGPLFYLFVLTYDE
jgi:hypothetical protein